MTTAQLRTFFALLAPALLVCAFDATGAAPRQDEAAKRAPAPVKEKTVQVHYLEIVTPDVDKTCEALAKLHGARFGEAEPGLGNARTAPLAGGGRIGVRAPLRPDEEPVVRPYVLVDDIEAAVKQAAAAGGEIALPPMELPGHGTCAIYFQGGIEHGLWQR